VQTADADRRLWFGTVLGGGVVSIPIH